MIRVITSQIIFHVFTLQNLHGGTVHAASFGCLQVSVLVSKTRKISYRKSEASLSAGVYFFVVPLEVIISFRHRRQLYFIYRRPILKQLSSAPGKLPAKQRIEKKSLYSCHLKR